MTADRGPIGLGLIGWSETSRFIVESLSLRDDLQLVAICQDEDADDCRRSDLARLAPPQCRPYLTPFDVMKDPDVRLIHFASDAKLEWMRMALRGGKAILLESPQSLSAAELEQLAEKADRCRLFAAIYEPRRWDGDFLQACSAIESGRLGRLLRLRLFIYDCRLPGEVFPQGIARELGSHAFDQMLQLVGVQRSEVKGQKSEVRESSRSSQLPHQSSWRQFPIATDGSEGFVATFELPNDVSAVIEIQTRSLLAFRSGWMIEGATGAYRAGRLYTQTADGEIIDEPWPVPPVSRDPFFDALVAALRGHSCEVPTIRDAVRVAELLASIPS